MSAPRWARWGLAVVGTGGLALAPASVSLAAASPGPAVHVVKRGESLSVIARRYRVSVPAMVTANHLSDAAVRIRAGQRLIIPAAGVAPAVRRPASPPANAASGAPRSDGMPSFEWPVEGTVTSHFGRRSQGWHRGIDIQADRGMPVRAAAGGTVVASGYEDRYGLVVKVEHSPDMVTVYAHTLQNFVEVGEEVQAGQLIGQVGRSGQASNYHLHFEIRHAGVVYNPLLLLPWPMPITPPLIASSVSHQEHAVAEDETYDDDGRQP